MNVSLKYRIAIIIFALEAIMMGIVLWQTLGHSFKASQKQMAANEQALLGVISGVSRNALLTEEYAELQPYLNEVRENPNIQRLLLSDVNGRVVASTHLQDIGLAMPVMANSGDRYWRHKVITNIGGTLGDLAIEFSTRALIEANAESRRLGIGIALGGMSIIAVIGVLVGFILTRRLEQVTHAATQLAAGDMSVRSRISGSDEIGMLGKSFDAMAQAIQQHTVQLEEQVAERTAQLNQAREDAENANQAKSQFLSSMSHELRTPMNAIMGFAQVLEMDELTSEQRDNINEIINAGDHLLELINDILDLTRIEAGNIDLNLQPVEIFSMCESCTGLVESMADMLNIKLDFSRNECENITVLADETRLKQILLNLLSNAVKYNQDQGKVDIVCKYTANGMARISVRDTGIGIPEEKLARVFEPFNRLGAEYSDIQGTGIGLSISKNLVEGMGGRIGVNSTPNKGSEFWFELPIATASQAEKKDTASQRLPKPQIVKGNVSRLIIYIEDEPSNIRLLSAVLKPYPEYQMLIAETARAGIELTLQYQPDLILLDINLGNESGYDVYSKLQANDRTSTIPVIALSANAMPGDIEKTLQMGFQAYITKPIDIEQLFQTINDIFDKTQTGKEGQL